MLRNDKFYKDKKMRKEYIDGDNQIGLFYDKTSDYKTSTVCVVADEKMVPSIYIEEAEYLASCLYINEYKKEYIDLNLLSLEKSDNVRVSFSINYNYIKTNYPEFYEEFFDYKLNPRFVKMWDGTMVDKGETWRYEMKVSLDWFKVGIIEYTQKGREFWNRRRHLKPSISEHKKCLNKYYNKSRRRYWERSWMMEWKECTLRKDFRRDYKEMLIEEELWEENYDYYISSIENKEYQW